MLHLRYNFSSLYKVLSLLGDKFQYFFNWYSGGWSPIGSTRHCGQQWPIVPAPGDYDWEIGGMIGRGNRSTRRKPAPVPLCPPQTPHASQTRTRAAAVGSQRLTAWATAGPKFQYTFLSISFYIAGLVVLVWLCFKLVAGVKIKHVIKL
jgi:hypothetical protein